jgi:hypothetical protein
MREEVTLAMLLVGLIARLDSIAQRVLNNL